MSDDFDAFGFEEPEQDPSPEGGDVIARLPNKDVPGFSLEVKDRYRGLAREVLALRPTENPLALMATIRTIERECKYSFFQTIYVATEGTPTWKLYRRRALASYHALGLTDAAQEEERVRYHAEVALLIDLVVRETGDEVSEVQAAYEDLASIGERIGITTYEQIQEILLHGALVEGFEETRDPSLPNERVRVVLKSIFGEKMYRKAAIARITKDDQYLIYRNSTDETHQKEGNALIKRGLVQAEGAFLTAATTDAYLEAEQSLEGVSHPGDVKHLYKIRAYVSSFNGFNVIALKSFAVERSGGYDYLAALEALSEEQKMRIYIVSTIVHEFAHTYELLLLKDGLFDAYMQIIQEERAPAQREKYVSDYVLRHDELYQSTEYGLAREDFAEAVRIYTVNPVYLETYYPKRAAFIATQLSFIVRNGLTEALRDAS